jgi:hypothetical protein
LILRFNHRLEFHNWLHIIRLRLLLVRRLLLHVNRLCLRIYLWRELVFIGSYNHWNDQLLSLRIISEGLRVHSAIDVVWSFTNSNDIDRLWVMDFMLLGIATACNASWDHPKEHKESYAKNDEAIHQNIIPEMIRYCVNATLLRRSIRNLRECKELGCCTNTRALVISLD